MVSMLSTKLRQLGNIGILSLQGSLCRSTWAEANKIIESLNTTAWDGFALDASQLVHFDSKGLEWFFNFGKSMQKYGLTVCIYGLSEELLSVLELIDLEDSIFILPTEDDFLSLLGNISLQPA